MSTTLADQYYIKAQDFYPYDMQEVVENLDYALSYNDEHADANCLMGQLHTWQIRDLEKAEQHFQQALATNPYHVNACRFYAQHLIEVGNYAQAQRLITYALGIKGVDKSTMLELLALLFEHQKAYDQALESLEEAMLNTFDNDRLEELVSVQERVSKKQDLVRRFVFTS